MSKLNGIEAAGGQQHGEMGEYRVLPEQQQIVHRVQLEQRAGLLSRLKTTAKYVAAGAAVVGVALIAKEIQQFGVSPEASENAEVEVGPASSDIDLNVFVNLNTITSRFPLSVKTSLDRPGPSNCDVNILMTDQDEQVKTSTNTGVLFSEIRTEVTDSGLVEVEAAGEMQLTPSSVLWAETPILFEEGIKWTDRCYDFNEPNQAMDIAVTTVQQAGQIAAACAIGSQAGEAAIVAGIKQYVRLSGDIDRSTPDSDIVVRFSNLAEQQDAAYGEEVQEFDQVVGDKIEQYVDPDNGKHTIKTNFDGIKDCSEHKITFSAQQ